MNYDGTNQIALTNYPIDSYVFNTMGSWSPDGSKIAFTSSRGGEQSGIYVMNAANGGQLLRLTGGGAYPEWSPDGSKIAFTSNRDGDIDIYTMNLDGSGQTSLTNTMEYEGYLFSWSPDGNKIAFESGGNPDITIMNADGTERMKLTDNAEQPVWSPDGNKIAFHRDGEIYTMDADDGGNQVRLTDEHLLYENAPDWGIQTTLPPAEQDVSPPVISIPKNIELEATHEEGAHVTYTVTVKDDVDGTATLEEDGRTITQDNVGQILLSLANQLLVLYSGHLTLLIM
jgi:Tol biopolymer transport system component